MNIKLKKGDAQHKQKKNHMLLLYSYKKLNLRTKKCFFNKFLKKKKRIKIIYKKKP